MRKTDPPRKRLPRDNPRPCSVCYWPRFTLNSKGKEPVAEKTSEGKPGTQGLVKAPGGNPSSSSDSAGEAWSPDGGGRQGRDGAAQGRQPTLRERQARQSPPDEGPPGLGGESPDSLRRGGRLLPSGYWALPRTPTVSKPPPPATLSSSLGSMESTQLFPARSAVNAAVNRRFWIGPEMNSLPPTAATGCWLRRTAWIGWAISGS